MAAKSKAGIKRREILKRAGAATAAGLAPFASAKATGRVSVMVDPGGSRASRGPVTARILLRAHAGSRVRIAASCLQRNAFESTLLLHLDAKRVDSAPPLVL